MFPLHRRVLSDYRLKGLGDETKYIPAMLIFYILHMYHIETSLYYIILQAYSRSYDASPVVSLQIDNHGL